MSQRVMEIVLKARNELGKSLGEARAQLDKFRRESKVDPTAFNLDAGDKGRVRNERRAAIMEHYREYEANQQRLRAEAVKRIQFERRWQRASDAAAFSEWRAQENQKSMLVNRLLGPAAMLFALNGAKRAAGALKEMTEAVARGESTWGELVDTVARSVPIFGSAYSVTRDLMSVFSGEAATNARQMAQAQAELTRAASLVKVAGENKSRSDFFKEQIRAAQERIALSKQENQYAREKLQNELSEAAAIREINRMRKEGLEKNAAGTFGRANPAELTAAEVGVGQDAMKIREQRWKEYRAAEQQFNGDEARKARERERINRESERAITAIQKAAIAERKGIAEQWLKWVADRFNAANEKRKEIEQNQRERRNALAAAQLERHNERARSARELAEAYFGRSVTQYKPTVEGVMAGQQFSGIGAMANTNANIQNARDAAEQKRLLQRMTELLASTMAVNQQILRHVGGLGQIQIGVP